MNNISKNKPFFSVIIPLYNKQRHIKETIQTVLNQTFQDFEIVVVNDGSKDGSAKAVESIGDDRIRLIHQKNAGVSAARNRGIQESKAEYIAFLDADDLWMPAFLRTIYDLIQKYPEAGLYATAYTKMDSQSNSKSINIQGLPSKDYTGIVPNYFKSIVKGDALVWTSATCIPKKVFVQDNIWFPSGEKYGEDMNVWARIAMVYEIAYDTKVCAIYQIEAENNTVNGAYDELEPHKSFLMLKKYNGKLKDKEKMRYLEKHIEQNIATTISRNMKKGKKFFALKQVFYYKLSFFYTLKFLVMFLIPKSSYLFFQKFLSLLRTLR